MNDERAPKPPRGGDHELDVASILRRAKDPGDIGRVLRAIEDLRRDSSTQWIAELLQDTRLQLQSLVAAVEMLAARQDASADHLVDTSKMESYTTDIVLEHGRDTFCSIDTPRTSLFHAKAVSAIVVAPHDRTSERFATLKEATIAQQPLLFGPVPLERWKAPPGRGHPIDWLFSLCALAHSLDLVIENHDPACSVLLRLTLSGDPMDMIPPGWSCGPNPQRSAHIGMPGSRPWRGR